MGDNQKLVTIYIDGVAYDVPAGTNLVDVAKFYADNDIPVFCYHPKMEPVGMCRMCLVEMGMVKKNRETGEIERDADGNPQIQWFPKLQTACTQLVSDGLAIRTETPVVTEAREDIVEFILTSHPLDCPICDKGGECPLQNLTMRHGPGQSVFHYEDKLKLDKHVPLGELIYLDRERCIQCARCVRYCDEYVGDDVLAFHERGRSLQIVTISDPAFDSKFSGNTTDICPVGALTTADFRFGARPWELDEVPSLDPYGPEGANISLSTRLDRDSGGGKIIKRVMPRQNEQVNEIWISDKTRFGHHHSRAAERLTTPMIRKGTKWAEATWTEALDLIASKLQEAASVGAIAGPDQSNEDLWELRQLVATKGEGKLGLWPALMSGGEVVRQVGAAKGTNIGSMGKGDTIVVVASDLEEEAPIWWLRVKSAGDRGANIVVLNARPTKLSHVHLGSHKERHTTSILYPYGEAVGAVNDLAKNAAIKEANNLLVFCGAEGLNLEQHATLMQACANLLIGSKHVGRPNNGLIPVWPGANIQGAIDLGYTAEATLEIFKQAPDVLFIAGCNPMGEVVEAAALEQAPFIVVTEQFTTTTSHKAHVILPRQSFAERDGTFTNGERRVQRFYAAQGVIGASMPEWKMFGELRARLGQGHVKLSAGAVMAEITKQVPAYVLMSYKNLAHVERQFPDVGGRDQYYGGTAYQNKGGLGVQWSVEAENADAQLTETKVKAEKAKHKGLLVVPTTLLFDQGTLFRHSELMHHRIPQPHVLISEEDAAKEGIMAGMLLKVTILGVVHEVQAVVSNQVPAGAILFPRRLSELAGPLAPTPVESIEKVPQAVIEG